MSRAHPSQISRPSGWSRDVGPRAASRDEQLRPHPAQGRAAGRSACRQVDRGGQGRSGLHRRRSATCPPAGRRRGPRRRRRQEDAGLLRAPPGRQGREGLQARQRGLSLTGPGRLGRLGWRCRREVGAGRRRLAGPPPGRVAPTRRSTLGGGPGRVSGILGPGQRDVRAGSARCSGRVRRGRTRPSRPSRAGGRWGGTGRRTPPRARRRDARTRSGPPRRRRGCSPA